MPVADQLDLLPDDDVLPGVTVRGLAIGIVGAGAIVRAGHLPAYQQAGFRVSAITDLDPARANAAAADFPITTVHRDLAGLLDDSTVDIIDIAIPPDQRAAVVRAAIAAGKHVLAQKPLSTDLGVAEELTGLAARAGVLLAVNQQMRWDQVIRSMKHLLRVGFYGEVTGAVFDVHIQTDWSLWPWLLDQPRLEYFFHSIHYVDAIRSLFGEPHSVIARTARYPGQQAAGESRSFTLYEFDTDRVVTVLADHNNWSSHPRASIRCAGTDGQSEGTLGVLYDYPVGRPDTFSYWSRTTAPQHTVTRAFTQRWIPDAFIGPMADLQDAVTDGREPVTSARDNLRTLRCVDAAYRSAELGRRVYLDEVSP